MIICILFAGAVKGSNSHPPESSGIIANTQVVAAAMTFALIRAHIMGMARFFSLSLLIAQACALKHVQVL